MIPILVAALGVAALIVGWLLLRTLGPRYRVGRLLAVTPRVSVAEAVELAGTERPPYLRVDGRIDAEDEFEDAAHRPLVYRRTRVEVRSDRGWIVVEDGREVVAFDVREGLSGIGVDGDGIDVGLVVVPRVSSGVAADIPDRVPADVASQAPARITIEQLSSVDHATVLGVPGRDATGRSVLAAGRGRPLIVTNLEIAEAMRILAGGRRVLPSMAAVSFAGGAILLVLAIVLAVAGVR